MVARTADRNRISNTGFRQQYQDELANLQPSDLMFGLGYA